jgi:hypothetical protein
MPLDDGRMTETCCGNNIGRGEEEEFMHWRTHNCFVNWLYLYWSRNQFVFKIGFLCNSGRHVYTERLRYIRRFWETRLFSEMWALTQEQTKSVALDIGTHRTEVEKASGGFVSGSVGVTRQCQRYQIAACCCLTKRALRAQDDPVSRAGQDAVLQERDGLVGGSRRPGAVGNAVHCEDVAVCRRHRVDFRGVAVLRDQLRLCTTRQTRRRSRNAREDAFPVTCRLKRTYVMLSWWSVVVNSLPLLLSRVLAGHILDVSDLHAASIFRYGSFLKYIIISISFYKCRDRKLVYASTKSVVFLYHTIPLHYQF